MSVWASLMLIGFFIIIYVVIVEIFTVLFRLTGLTEEKARMQVISMLTNCGFTTSESEVVLAFKRRRMLAKITMLSGYSFNVIIVSSIVNVFLALNSAEARNLTWAVLAASSMLLLTLALMRVHQVKTAFDLLIERLGNHLLFGKSSNVFVLLDMYGENAIVEVALDQIPDFLKETRLMDSGLKKIHGIHVVLLKRGGLTLDHVGGEIVLQTGDRVVLFGVYKNIKTIFENPEKQALKQRGSLKDEEW